MCCMQLAHAVGEPLGINIKGGMETALNAVYIANIIPLTVAQRCGRLRVDDQILMLGNECLVGVTAAEANSILLKAAKEGVVEVCVCRRKLEESHTKKTEEKQSRRSLAANDAEVKQHRRSQDLPGKEVHHEQSNKPQVAAAEGTLLQVSKEKTANRESDKRRRRKESEDTEQAVDQVAKESHNLLGADLCRVLYICLQE